VLGEILARWLSVANEAVSARGGIQGPVETAHAVLDLDVLRRLVGDEADTAILMLADYGQSLQSSLQSLRQAEANGELAEVGRIAHRLKSSSRAVGALPFGDLCAELENASRKASQIMVTRAMARFETATAELLSEIDRHIGEN
jgi:HPt (histidine-containing phosphotransfer) domain-containing protein